MIRVEGLGKKYRIRHQRPERYSALRDVIAQKALGAFRWRRGEELQSPVEEDFWALKFVSFEIKRGDVVGIIGRNGAGKSTLLKILSRITEPTEGRVVLNGHVAALLEVGTGFHPELTGRENIFLNGAILGMGRAEIKKRFDEIVAFAEVDQFLDTPVKRYSSGMYVRLAFAVAAHLEPEILVIDEVLSVGDVAFQKKCLGKVNEVSKEDGRTVLFVSHNLPSVKAMCRDVIVLRNGRITFQGNSADGIGHYLEGTRGFDPVDHGRLQGRAELIPDELQGAQAFRIKVSFSLKGPLAEPRLGIGINNSEGVRVATLFTETSRQIRPVLAAETLYGYIETEPVRLAPGSYSIKLALAELGSDIEVIEHADEVVVPAYSPFDRPPLGIPRGNLLVRHKVVLE